MTTTTTARPAATEPARYAAALADGVAELAAAADHDLRGRLRRLQREAEAWVVANDPSDAWADFDTWLTGRAVADVVTSHTELCRRADALAEALGVSVALPATPAWPNIALGAAPSTPAHRELGFSALKGGCGGVITASLLAGLAGVAVALPASLIAASAFGAKAWHDDRVRHLGQRRGEARVAVQRFVDEVAFHAGDGCRASVRELQRRLRAAGGLPGVVEQRPVPVGDGSPASRPALPGIAGTTAVLPPNAAGAVRRPAGGRRWALAAAVIIVAGLVATSGALLSSGTGPAGAAARTPTASTAAAADVVARADLDRDVRQFANRLVAASRDGDRAFLLGSLHPEVVVRYGSACMAYLDGVDVFPLDLTVREVGAPSAWSWSTDGRTTILPDVVSVEVSRVDASQTIVQELHLVRTATGLRWLTDCGDPQPVA